MPTSTFKGVVPPDYIVGYLIAQRGNEVAILNEGYGDMQNVLYLAAGTVLNPLDSPYEHEAITKDGNRVRFPHSYSTPMAQQSGLAVVRVDVYPLLELAYKYR